LKAWLENYFNRIWYETSKPPLFLTILSLVYQTLIELRRSAYQLGLFKSTSIPVPVIIVGNLSVGGTGKTPLTLWLVDFLHQQDYQPGVICSGYGGNFASTGNVELLTCDADPFVYGDEAVLIAARSVCPVVVGKSRVAAAQHLLSNSDCDIIISDDGLQHLGLKRDIEIIVIDGMRLFGNRRCLPAGPLREPVSHINSVDLLVSNGNSYPNASTMTLVGSTITNLLKRDLQLPLSSLQNKPVHVITGIGNPQRFFSALTQAGLRFDTRVFPDHHHFTIDDLHFNDDYPLLMTEKDAVKCYHLATENYWVLPVEAHLDSRFSESLRQLLENNHGRCKTT
jgi:tetraacyldisaccharide 4'-kinase